MGEPVELHLAQIGVGEFLQRIHATRALDRDLREVVAQIGNGAVEATSVVTHPVEIFFTRAGIDHDQVVVIGHFVHDNVVDECSLGIEHRRILSLSNTQLRSVIDGDVLDGRERLRSVDTNVTHVTHIENADAVAHREMLGDQAAMLGIFDRHVPAVEVDHLGAHLAMNGIQCGFTGRGDIRGDRQNRFLSASPDAAGQTRKVNTTGGE